MTTPPVRFSISADDEQTLVLHGELDAHSAPTLAAKLAEFDASRTMTLDVSALDFIDSSGLRVIIEADQRARQASGSLVLQQPSRTVSRVLDLSGLGSMLNIV